MMFCKSLESLLFSFTTILRIVRTSPVSLIHVMMYKMLDVVQVSFSLMGRYSPVELIFTF